MRAKYQSLVDRIVDWALVGRLALFAVIGAGCYYNALDAPFIFDDLKGIAESPAVRQLWPPSAVMDIGQDETPRGRPVVAFSLAANFAVSELEVWSYHLLNLVIHVGAALLLFRLTRLLLRHSPDAQALKGGVDGPALAVALIWLTHPLATSVVTYTVQRAESSMALFYLLAMHLAVCSFVADKRRRILQIAAIGACWIGVGCKESFATAPVAIFLLDWGVLKNQWKEIRRERTWFYVGLASCWLALALLMIEWPRSQSVGGGQIGSLDYFLMQWQIIVQYLKVIVLPGGLSLDYVWQQPSFAQALPYGLFLTGLAVGAGWLFFIKRVAAAFPLLFLFLVMGPTSSVVPIHTSVGGDHRVYLPLAGLIFLGVFGCVLELRRLNLRPDSLRVVGVALTCALISALSYETVKRNRDYRSGISIWRDVTEKQPWNDRAWSNLGGHLYVAGIKDEAFECYRKSVQLNSNDGYTLSGYGLILGQRGRYEEAGETLLRAIELIPRDVMARVYLGLVATDAGELEFAAESFRGALSLDLTHAKANFYLAEVYSRQGRYAEALAHVEQTLRTQPDFPGAAQSKEELMRTLQESGR